MDLPILLDGRNVFDAEMVIQAGLEYISVGRKSARPRPAVPAVYNMPPSQVLDRADTIWS
jgi:hypothetical protein